MGFDYFVEIDDNGVMGFGIREFLFLLEYGLTSKGDF